MKTEVGFLPLTSATTTPPPPLAPPPLLIVDDDEVTRHLLQEVLQKSDFQVQLAHSGEAALGLLSQTEFAVVLSDIRMLELDGMAVLKAVQKSQKGTVVILMTAFGSMAGAVAAIQAGAFDYVSKPFRMDELREVVFRALKHWELTQKARQEEVELGAHVGVTLKSRTLIGKSPPMVEVYKLLARAALSPSTVLVLGESGTGKELVARAIHEHSPRRQRNFIAVNCGALAENLLESELFGHMKGSFTGALNDRSGLFEEAHGGTLFLDEIGDISPALQIKLLRVLQEGEFKPVGAGQSKKVNVRLVVATHQDLEVLVRQGRFREDLFYRLKVITIALPPLRQRMEDLHELVEYFLAFYAQKNQKQISHVSEEAMALLREYAWPGNIRELEHSLERAVALSNTTVLFAKDFPAEIHRATHPTSLSTTGSAEGKAGLESAWEGEPPSLEDLEKAHILRVLAAVDYNKSRASEILGIDRATLYRKADRYGITLRNQLHSG